jgi:hypothetical protein
LLDLLFRELQLVDVLRPHDRIGAFALQPQLFEPFRLRGRERRAKSLISLLVRGFRFRSHVGEQFVPFLFAHLAHAARIETSHRALGCFL